MEGIFLAAKRMGKFGFASNFLTVIRRKELKIFLAAKRQELISFHSDCICGRCKHPYIMEEKSSVLPSVKNTL